MHKIIAGVAIAAVWAAVPAFAADKMGAETDTGAGTQSQALGNMGEDTRHKGEDGSLQGKPVVKGPADWSHARAPGGSDAGSASSGESAGEAGQDADPER